MAASIKTTGVHPGSWVKIGTAPGWLQSRGGGASITVVATGGAAPVAFTDTYALKEDLLLDTACDVYATGTGTVTLITK